MTEYEQAGYISLTRSKKAIQIKAGESRYFAPKYAVKKVLDEEKDYATISRPTEEDGEEIDETPTSYPSYVNEEIRKMNDEYNVEILELVEKYKEIFNTDWIQEDDNFDSDRERHSYCIRRLWIELVGDHGGMWEWNSPRVTCRGEKR